MQFFADSPGEDTVRLPNGFDVLVLYLLRDGYLKMLPFVPLIKVSGVEWGPQDYRLTPLGRQFINDFLRGLPLDPPDEEDDQSA